MSLDPNILIVLATTVCIFAASSVIASWVERRWPILSAPALLIGIAILFAVHRNMPDGLQLLDIPNAFIAVVAMIL